MPFALNQDPDAEIHVPGQPPLRTSDDISQLFLGTEDIESRFRKDLHQQRTNDSEARAIAGTKVHVVGQAGIGFIGIRNRNCPDVVGP